MNTHDTLITNADYRRLRSLAARLKASGRSRREHVTTLNRYVKSAQIVASRDIPRNVVTLDSQVVLKDLDSRKRLFCTLADPHDMGLLGDRLSVAAPAGIALLGKRVGQIVRWMLGGKLRRFRIEQILYQPEAAGNFDH